MEDINFIHDVKFDVKKETVDALIASVALGFPIPSWMRAMGTGKMVPPSLCAPNDAWLEMVRRHREVKEVASVKSYITEAMKGRTVTISPESVVCKTSDVVTNFVVVGGFHVPESHASREKTMAAVATEVAIESVLFSQETDPTVKRQASLTVNPEAALKLDIPLYPIVAACGGKFYKASVIEANLRNREKTSPGAVVEFLTSNMPRHLPNTKKEFKWMGVSFKPTHSLYEPSRISQNTIFKCISDHRAVRGTDHGRRSLYTKGYYWGYMDHSVVKACEVVSDLEYIVNTTGSLRYLEVQNVDGIFSEIALLSLVANGWVVRVVNGHALQKYECKVDDDGKISVPPGIYSKITKCVAPFFVYVNLDEKTPTVVKNSVVGRMEVNLVSISDRLSELSEMGSSRVAFTYVYYRDELDAYTSYLYPTSHAHSGQLIYCNMRRKQALSLAAYAMRIVHANVYKTGFVYYRTPFFTKDTFASPYPFNMTVRSKLKASTQWEDADFKLNVLEGTITKIVIDYDMLRAQNPGVMKAVAAVEGKLEPAEVKQLIKQVIQIQDDEDIAQVGSLLPKPPDKDKDDSDDEYHFGSTNDD